MLLIFWIINIEFFPPEDSNQLIQYSNIRVKKSQWTIAIENKRLDLLIVQIFSNLVSNLLNKS